MSLILVEEGSISDNMEGNNGFSINIIVFFCQL